MTKNEYIEKSNQAEIDFRERMDSLKEQILYMNDETHSYEKKVLLNLWNYANTLEIKYDTKNSIHDPRIIDEAVFELNEIDDRHIKIISDVIDITGYGTPEGNRALDDAEVNDLMQDMRTILKNRCDLYLRISERQTLETKLYDEYTTEFYKENPAYIELCNTFHKAFETLVAIISFPDETDEVLNSNSDLNQYKVTYGQLTAVFLKEHPETLPVIREAILQIVTGDAYDLFLRLKELFNFQVSGDVKKPDNWEEIEEELWREEAERESIEYDKVQRIDTLETNILNSRTLKKLNKYGRMNKYFHGNDKVTKTIFNDWGNKELTEFVLQTNLKSSKDKKPGELNASISIDITEVIKDFGLQNQLDQKDKEIYDVISSCMIAGNSIISSTYLSNVIHGNDAEKNITDIENRIEKMSKIKIGYDNLEETKRYKNYPRFIYDGELLHYVPIYKIWNGKKIKYYSFSMQQEYDTYLKEYGEKRHMLPLTSLSVLKNQYYTTTPEEMRLTVSKTKTNVKIKNFVLQSLRINPKQKKIELTYDYFYESIGRTDDGTVKKDTLKKQKSRDKKKLEKMLEFYKGKQLKSYEMLKDRFIIYK